MSETYTDPASGRQYTVDPATGQSRWIDEQPAGPAPGTSPPPGGAPQWGAPPVPHKKSHPIRNTILALVAVVVVIMVVSAALNNGSSTNSTASGGSSPAASQAAGSAASGKPAAKKAGIGTPVRDGKFQFTVIKVKPGVTKVGDEYLNATAQGQFVLVTVKVENIGDEAQLFDGSSQKLFDSKGRKFDADSSAAIYLGDQSKSFLNDINPGNAVTGVVVFDVPKGVQLAKLELHDSPFSGGADVALG